MNLTEVCRLCLVKSMKTSEELFFPIDEVFENKFLEITNSTLNSSEGFPSTVCISCVTEFEDFYNYRNGLIQKQKRLNLLIGVKNEKLMKTEAPSKKPAITEEPLLVNLQTQEIQNEEQSEEVKESDMEELTNKQYENTELVYKDDDDEMGYFEEQGGTSRIIFEEVLENEHDEDTYELEFSEQQDEDAFIRHDKNIKLKLHEEYLQNEDEEEFMESTDECIGDMEQIDDDDEIIFAITADDISDECIVVKTEDSFLEGISNERQKRKYVKQGKEKEKLYKCWIDDCKAAFSFRSTMKKHVYQMHRIPCDKNTCLMCGQRFEEYSEFLNHVKKHTRKAECDICKLTFVSTEKMQTHRDRVHKNDENERTFQCHLCDASFKRKEHVNSHIIYRHTESRKYPCQQCSSAFLTKQDLKNHEKSHQQLKKNCAYCPYDCRDLKSIKLHCLKVHNTTKIYKCSCEEAFELFKDYQSHKKNCYSVVDSTTSE